MFPESAPAMMCPICKSSKHTQLARRPRIPVLQNRVWPTREAALLAPGGTLTFLLCRSCGFGWNAAFDEDLINYDKFYDNDQTNSVAFDNHLADMADRIVRALPPETQSIVEVGCGQGAFIERLQRIIDKRINLFGFDPAWRGRAIAGASIFPVYFNADTVERLPDKAEFVLSRHTIEHIANPLSFLRAIRKAMMVTPRARLFLETPDLDWILDKQQPQDLFYEHCSLFSESSFRVALAASGFQMEKIERVFGGQYFWVTARPTDDSPRETPEQIADTRDDFEESLMRIVSEWRHTVGGLSLQGPVLLWGASSKGVTFSLLLGDDRDRLSAAIDQNTKKIGGFMPITGVPIIAPEQLPNNASVIIMNPNYAAEIQNSVLSAGRDARLFVLSENGAIQPIEFALGN
jgi:SAM-dependent methyltransferase